MESDSSSRKAAKPIGLLFSTTASRNQARIARGAQHIRDLLDRAAAGPRQCLIKDAGPNSHNQIEAGREEGAHDEAGGDGELILIQVRQECCD